MGKEFNNVLDECLERLLARGETIEQCLQGCPGQASELKPLLETALAVKKASDIQPRAEFKARARYQFHSALEEAASQRSRPAFGWLPRWATVATVVLGFLLVGSGTVAAAGYSMPDSPLYPVKLTTEQVQLKLTPSTMGKAELQVRLADRRVVEIIYMADKGDAQRIEVIAQRLDKRLATLAGLVSAQKMEGAPQVETPLPAAAPSKEAKTFAPSPALVAPEEARGGGREVPAEMNKRAKLRIVMARHAANHPAALRAVLKKAPESTKPALRRAIAITEARYQQALEAVAD